MNPATPVDEGLNITAVGYRLAPAPVVRYAADGLKLCAVMLGLKGCAYCVITDGVVYWAAAAPAIGASAFTY